jgi:hypothetical protein
VNLDSFFNNGIHQGILRSDTLVMKLRIIIPSG